MGIKKEIKRIRKKIKLLQEQSNFDRRYDKFGVFSDSNLELEKEKNKLMLMEQNDNP